MENDKLVECKHCNSKLCYEKQTPDFTLWTCFTCGFVANSKMIVGSSYYEEQTSILPEVYKEVIYVEDSGIVWIPNFVKKPEMGMVYLNKNKKGDYEWNVVKEIPIPEEEQNKYPIPHKKGEFYKFKTDMSTLKEFDLNNYMGALDYLMGK